MAAATAFARQEAPQNRRFSDDMFTTPWPQQSEPKPSPLEPITHKCPYCDQHLPQGRTSIISVFLSGIGRLIAAIGMIIGAIIRCARLAVATVLCLVGVVGFCCRSLGLKIAHPHDRRFFVNPQRRGPN